MRSVDCSTIAFIVALVVVSIVCLSTLVVWEWRHKDPLIDMRLFTSFNFSGVSLMMFLAGAHGRGSFAHLFGKKPVRLVRPFQREDPPPQGAFDRNGIHVAGPDRRQRFLYLGQMRAEPRDLPLSSRGATLSHRSGAVASVPAEAKPVLVLTSPQPVAGREVAVA